MGLELKIVPDNFVAITFSFLCTGCTVSRFCRSKNRAQKNYYFFDEITD